MYTYMSEYGFVHVCSVLMEAMSLELELQAAMGA